MWSLNDYGGYSPHMQPAITRFLFRSLFISLLLTWPTAALLSSPSSERRPPPPLFGDIVDNAPGELPTRRPSRSQLSRATHRSSPIRVTSRVSCSHRNCRAWRGNPQRRIPRSG